MVTRNENMAHSHSKDNKQATTWLKTGKYTNTHNHPCLKFAQTQTHNAQQQQSKITRCENRKNNPITLSIMPHASGLHCIIGKKHAISLASLCLTLRRWHYATWANCLRNTSLCLTPYSQQ